ncbi:MAG: serine hydrolase [Acidobacteriota bacterium]
MRQVNMLHRTDIKLKILLALLLMPIVARAAEPGTVGKLREVIGRSGAAEVGLAFHDLETGRRLLINERRSFHAASTMKLPVMMEVFRRARAGEFSLTDKIPVKDRFQSIVDGSEYQLSADSDSDREIYQRVGTLMTIRELVERMITMSSNLATNILIEHVRPENVRQLTRELGARDIQVRRGVEDTKAFQAGLNNTTTAFDLMLLLQTLADCRDPRVRDCAEMIDILAAQQFNDAIPAGLPPGTRVAHKTGEITRHQHDAAIVYPQSARGRNGRSRRPYILVILTRGIADQAQSSRLIAELTSIIHKDQK